MGAGDRPPLLLALSIDRAHSLAGVCAVMRESLWVPITGLVLIATACAAIASAPGAAANPQRDHALIHSVVPMDDSAWHHSPPGLPTGSRFAVISGDLAKPEHFMMRVELPPGYTVLPYRRSTEENIVVLAGSLELGSGRKFDDSSLRPLTRGSFVSLRANEPHFAMTKEGATVQICVTRGKPGGCRRRASSSTGASWAQRRPLRRSVT
jgi:quercetin dioxygenase-like cupin family protein